MSAGFAVVLPLGPRRHPLLIGYGRTRFEALESLCAQIARASVDHKRVLQERYQVVGLSADEASEVAECIAAEAIGWAS